MFFILIYFFLLHYNISFAGESKPFSEGEDVVLWVNKVGPFANPQETYPYYFLPYCKPEKEIETHMEGLGEALQGYELRQSAIKFQFKRDTEKTEICTKKLNNDEVYKFRYAVSHQYWYQLFVDELPVWGMVGEIISSDSNDKKLLLFTHMKFSISYNGDRIIEVNLTSDDRVIIEQDTPIKFTYSVNWYPTDIPFEKRFNKYLDNNFFEHQIHWFSIFNSFIIVIILVGLVSIILMRTLKKNYAKYSKPYDELEDDHDVGEESGWKQVHGDVFRPPSHLVLFSSLVGTGHQLAILVLCIILLSIVDPMYSDRGTTVTAFIVCYAITSFIGGYGGGSYYARNDGKNWIKTMLLTASLFPGVCFLVSFFLNFIALAYGSLAAIPFITMIILFLIWFFVSFPLTIIGTIVGRNWNGVSDNPCRINPVPRQIPEKKWYMEPVIHIFLGGILPFGSIIIEMYFIFTSFWHYKYYYVYGFMLLVYIILIIVSICVTIVSTYFLLNSEDYRWQWTSFLSSASTALYVYLYSIYYFFGKTKMTGFFQTCFYFGYMFLFCFGMGILCGAVGFIGTSIFVKRIY
jgi:transmembrane 9 superfamily protein 3